MPQATRRTSATRRVVYGERHPRAVLTDHEARLMLSLREEGFTMAWLAMKFEISKACVWSICSGRTRACP